MALFIRFFWNKISHFYPHPMTEKEWLKKESWSSQKCDSESCVETIGKSLFWLAKLSLKKLMPYFVLYKFIDIRMAKNINTKTCVPWFENLNMSSNMTLEKKTSYIMSVWLHHWVQNHLTNLRVRMCPKYVLSPRYDLICVEYNWKYPKYCEISPQYY